MLFVAEYRLNPHMPKTDVKRLMDEFGKQGAPEGELAHYVRADATGGFTVDELEDLDAAYEASLAYSEFLQFTITPVLKIDDAIGPIMTYIG